MNLTHKEKVFIGIWLAFSAIFTATSAFIFLNKKDDKNNKKYSTGMAILILSLSRCRNGISRYISRVRNISTNVILFPSVGNKK